MKLDQCRKCTMHKTYKISGTCGVVLCAVFGDGVRERSVWLNTREDSYRVNCPIEPIR